ncbi:universal stress protein [Oceanisphaera ostreae]|uniref:Universal stress protein n=1 Tax=Oceanisphaera ostreae TaxID=914151 RepID=A0ABW3KK14_9GAMM
MPLPEINKILYATSLGPYTRSVYRHAMRVAKQNNAEIIMLHVITSVGELGEALIREYLPKELVKKVHAEGVAKVIKTMETRVQDFFDEELSYLDEPMSWKITPRVVQGRHDEMILNVAKKEGVDIIIMGTENKLGIYSQSDTTQQVIKRSKVPVLVVPTNKESNW